MKYSAITLAIGLILFLTGCTKTSIVEPPAKQTSQPGSVTLAIGKAPADIFQIIAHLTRDGYTPQQLVLTLADSGQSASGTFSNIAIGTWHLKINAYGADTTVVLYTGEIDIQVLPGQTSTANLTLVPATGNIQIQVTWGGSLVLYYPFKGTTIDSSGYGNNGSSVNAAYTSDPWGHANSAYLFNGVDNYITVPNSSSLNVTNQLTIACWLRVDTIQSNHMPVLVKGGPVVGYLLNREYAVHVKQNYSTWYLQFESAGDGQGQHEDFSPSYNVGTWGFYVFVADRINHEMIIYTNAAVAGTAADSYSSFNQNTNTLIVGFSEESPTFPDHTPLVGAMANLRIYNRVLSPLEIASLYSSHR